MNSEDKGYVGVTASIVVGVVLALAVACTSSYKHAEQRQERQEIYCQTSDEVCKEYMLLRESI